jgi:hypothetical protein
MGLHPYENPVTPPPFPEAGTGTPLRTSAEIAEERLARMEEEERLREEEAQHAEEEEDGDEETSVTEETHDMSPEGYGSLVHGGTYAETHTPSVEPEESDVDRRERALNSLAMDNLEGGEDQSGDTGSAPVVSTSNDDTQTVASSAPGVQPQDLTGVEDSKVPAQEENPAFQPIPDERAIVPFEEGKNLLAKKENNELAKVEEKPFIELKAPTTEKPFEDRLQYAEDLIQQLEEREKQRQEDRFKVRPWKPFKFMENSLTAANKWLNGTHAGAFTASAVAGPALAPILFAMGAKTYTSGTIEAVQNIFCGWKKDPETGKWGVSSSMNDRFKLETLKQDMFAHAQTELSKVREDFTKGLFTEDQLAFEISRIADDLESAEKKIIDEENRVIKSEKSRERFRGLVSSASTVALGLLGGVPLGTHNFDTDSVNHAVHWSMHGFGFNYHPGEIAGTMTHSLANIAPGASPLTTYQLGGHLAHSLGNTPPELYAGMIAGGAGLAAKTIAEMGRPRSVGSPDLEKAMMTWHGSPDGPPPAPEGANPESPKGPEGEQPAPEKPGEQQGEYKETPSETLDAAKELATDHIEGKPAAITPKEGEEPESKPAVEQVVSPEKEKSTFKADFEHWLNTTAAGGGKAADSKEVKKFLWWAGVKWHEENGQVKLDDIEDLLVGTKDYKEVKKGKKGKDGKPQAPLKEIGKPPPPKNLQERLAQAA